MKNLFKLREKVAAARHNQNWAPVTEFKNLLGDLPAQVGEELNKAAPIAKRLLPEAKRIVRECGMAESDLRGEIRNLVVELVARAKSVIRTAENLPAWLHQVKSIEEKTPQDLKGWTMQSIVQGDRSKLLSILSALKAFDGFMEKAKALETQIDAQAAAEAAKKDVVHLPPQPAFAAPVKAPEMEIVDCSSSEFDPRLP